MTHAEDHSFEDFTPEADAVEQLTPISVDEDDDAALSQVRVRVSPSDEADEGDLIEQALVVPLGDDPEFDR
ncbi:hypothetical protein ACWDTP_14970 [Mycobacterium sp. NPDC003449]